MADRGGALGRDTEWLAENPAARYAYSVDRVANRANVANGEIAAVHVPSTLCSIGVMTVQIAHPHRGLSLGSLQSIRQEQSDLEEEEVLKLT